MTYAAPLSALLCLLLFSLTFLPATAEAEKVYIDIASPGIRPLVVAVQPFSGGKALSDIVKDDLTFTGLFVCLDDAAQIERPEQPFNAASWKGLGTELVVKGRTQTIGGKTTVVISAYDVGDGREVLRKEYSATADLSRPLAHTISNDLYKLLTGQEGMFKSKIAYVVEKGGSREMHLMDWDGYRDYNIGVRGDIILTPRWAADGSKLLYSASKGRRWGIFVLDMNTMKERSVLPLVGLSIAGNFFPDNKRFVYSTSRDGNSDILIGDVATGASQKIISSPWIDVSPALSPNGYFLAFVSNRSGGPQIYFSDREGYGLRRLSFEGSYNTSPIWSPQGDRIVYTSMVGGKSQIFVMKADGSDPKQLTFHGGNEDPSFSPDGRHVAFTSTRDGGKAVYLMRINGEGQQRVTPKGVNASAPGWSQH